MSAAKMEPILWGDELKWRIAYIVTGIFIVT